MLSCKQINGFLKVYLFGRAPVSSEISRRCPSGVWRREAPRWPWGPHGCPGLQGQGSAPKPRQQPGIRSRGQVEGSCFGATCPRSEQHRLHPRLLSRSWHGCGAALPSPPGELFFSQAMFLGADSQSPAGPEHASRSWKGRGAASCK